VNVCRSEPSFGGNAVGRERERETWRLGRWSLGESCESFSMGHRSELVLYSGREEETEHRQGRRRMGDGNGNNGTVGLTAILSSRVSQHLSLTFARARACAPRSLPPLAYTDMGRGTILAWPSPAGPYPRESGQKTDIVPWASQNATKRRE
jgi:hypothetical protein